MGSVMGMPSLSIYVNELIRELGVKTLIRVGACGGLQPHLRIGSSSLSTLAAKHGVAVSRIAHGVPLGGELEFTDQSTIAHAFSSRQAVES